MKTKSKDWNSNKARLKMELNVLQMQTPSIYLLDRHPDMDPVLLSLDLTSLLIIPVHISQ
jgi:hypothetical protein